MASARKNSFRPKNDGFAAVRGQYYVSN